mgnify:CR=1 FL=1
MEVMNILCLRCGEWHDVIPCFTEDGILRFIFVKCGNEEIACTIEQQKAYINQYLKEKI